MQMRRLCERSERARKLDRKSKQEQVWEREVCILREWNCSPRVDQSDKAAHDDSPPNEISNGGRKQVIEKPFANLDLRTIHYAWIARDTDTSIEKQVRRQSTQSC